MRRERIQEKRGGGGVYVSEVAMELTDVWRERTQEKVKFVNMRLGLDDITMFVRFFLLFKCGRIFV